MSTRSITPPTTIRAMLVDSCGGVINVGAAVGTNVVALGVEVALTLAVVVEEGTIVLAASAVPIKAMNSVSISSWISVGVSVVVVARLFPLPLCQCKRDQRG